MRIREVSGKSETVGAAGVFAEANVKKAFDVGGEVSFEAYAGGGVADCWGGGLGGDGGG